MKGKSINKTKAFSYFVLCSILLLSVLAFYLSCKSKSPTEANTPLGETRATRGANRTAQTTTSSSTTTTIKPLSSAAISTTIITSRNLTTTSTSTTTTSIIPTTTTITRTPTTSIELAADVRFCNVYGIFLPIAPGGSNVTAKNNFQRIDKQFGIPIQRGDTIYLPPGWPGVFLFTIKNVGDATAYRVKANVTTSNCSADYFFVFMETARMRLPNDRVCRLYPFGIIPDIALPPNPADLSTNQFLPGIILLYTNPDAPPGSCCKIIISLNWHGSTYSPKFGFKVCLVSPE